jgi:hypothetical protein
MPRLTGLMAAGELAFHEPLANESAQPDTPASSGGWGPTTVIGPLTCIDGLLPYSRVALTPDHCGLSVETDRVTRLPVPTHCFWKRFTRGKLPKVGRPCVMIRRDRLGLTG